MNQVIIYHHLGLGDHIMCNGLVRKLIEKNSWDKVYVITKDYTTDSVAFMYRDIPTIECVNVKTDREACDHIVKTAIPSIVIGHSNLNLTNQKVDECFYSQVGINLNEKWNSFRIDRDVNREKKLMDIFKISSDDHFVFVHDDNNKRIASERLSHFEGSVIRPIPSVTNNAFDYCSMIELADEVHCVDSSFRSLTDMLDVQGQLFFHKYASNAYKAFPGENGFPTMRKNWTVYS